MVALLAGGLPLGIAQKASDDLIKAVAKGEREKVLALVKEGADPNGQDSTKQPLICLAAYLGKEQIVAALLANGADIRAADHDGWNDCGVFQPISTVDRNKRTNEDNADQVVRQPSYRHFAVDGGRLKNILMNELAVGKIGDPAPDISIVKR